MVDGLVVAVKDGAASECYIEVEGDEALGLGGEGAQGPAGAGAKEASRLLEGVDGIEVVATDGLFGTVEVERSVKVAGKDLGHGVSSGPRRRIP